MTKITIKRNGQVIIDVDDQIKGTSCTELTKRLEEALGKPMKRELKSSYYEQHGTVDNQQTLGQG